VLELVRAGQTRKLTMTPSKLRGNQLVIIERPRPCFCRRGGRCWRRRGRFRSRLHLQFGEGSVSRVSSHQAVPPQPSGRVLGPRHSGSRARGKGPRVCSSDLVVRRVKEQRAALIQAGVSGTLHKHNPPDVLCGRSAAVAAGRFAWEKNYLKPLFRTLVRPVRRNRPTLADGQSDFR